MNHLVHILSELKLKKISLSLDESGTNLKLKGDLSVLTSSDKEKLKASKEAIIALLKESSEQSDIEIPQLTHGTTEFPLSPNQKGIWFHEKLEELGTAYVIPGVYFFEIPNFSPALFETSLLHLAENHDVLRFIVVETENNPIQKVKEAFEITEHYSILAVEDKASLEAQIEQKSQEVFAYSDRPLWDISIYQLPDSQFCFYLRMHHLIGDGESFGLFINELISGYVQLEKGQNLIAGQHLSYSDYVAWISDRNNFVKSTNFWKKEFVDYQENFQLHTDHSVSNQTSGETKSYSFGKDRSVRLKEWAQHKRVSLASLYTTATGIVLSKRGRSNDLVIGIPTASRNHPQLAKTIGNFVNTLPFRFQIDYALDAHSLIQTTQQKYVSILDHQIYPFEYILDDINYDRKVDKSPLFNVMVSIPNSADNQKDDQHEIELKKSTNLYDLTFVFIEIGDEIELVIEFNALKFHANTIDAICTEIDWVFEQLMSDKNKQLSDFTLAPIEQLEQLYTSDLSKTPNIDSFQSVVDLLKAQAQINPNSIAVVYSDHQSTYAQIYDRSERLAHHLLNQKGLKPAQRVVVSMEKTIEALIAMYAIWLAGGIYVPVDPNLPENRKKLIVEDCSPELIIDSAFFERFETSLQDSDAQNTRELPSIEPDATAYLLYTSGTTGRPKGVMISHENLANKIQEESVLLQVDAKSVMFGLTNSGFDVSFLEMVLPLCNGGKCILPTTNELEDTEQTIRSIGVQGVTHLQGTPTYFSHFSSLLTASSSAELHQLKFICIGGESLNAYLVQQLKSKLPHVQLNNHYGPTEITIDALVNQNVKEFSTNSIGFPFGQTTAYILDDQGNLLPANTVGELVIGGPSVFQGYWNDEQLTASKLKEVKFTSGKHYFTGDLARRMQNGEVEFIGRKDSQIKLRGYRIELDDISQTLVQFDGVDQAHSQVVNNVLVSWVVSTHTEDHLKTALQRILPSYMIPQSIELIESFPMTENGKIAASKLPIPKNLKAEHVAPRTELEAQIAAIWEEILEVENIGVYDDFFELGGHSLKAYTLLNKLNLHFHYNLQFIELMDHLTVHSLAEYVNKRKVGVDVQIQRAEKRSFYPTSGLQKKIYFLDQTNGGSSYNMSMAFLLEGDFCIDQIRESFLLIIENNPILRTVFFFEQGVLSQKYLDNLPIRLYCSTDTDFDENMSRFNDKFDFSGHEYLYRIGIEEKTPNQHHVFFNIHHILADGRSIELLFNEFIQHLTNQPTEKDRLEYVDYVMWLEQEQPENLKNKTFWMNKLKNSTFSNCVPLDFSRLKHRGEVAVLNSAIKLSKAELDNFSKSHSISSVRVIYAAFLISLLKKYNIKFTNLGTDVLGRSKRELENVIGMFVNNIILQNELDENKTFVEIVENVNNSFKESIEHQNYEFDHLVKDINLNSRDAINPLFQIMFNVVNEEELIKNIHSKTIGITQLNGNQNQRAKFDMSFAYLFSKNAFEVNFEYDTSIFRKETIQDLADVFGEVLEKCINQPNLKVNEVVRFNNFREIKPVSFF